MLLEEKLAISCFPTKSQSISIIEDLKYLSSETSFSCLPVKKERVRYQIFLMKPSPPKLEPHRILLHSAYSMFQPLVAISNLKIIRTKLPAFFPENIVCGPRNRVCSVRFVIRIQIDQSQPGICEQVQFNFKLGM